MLDFLKELVEGIPDPSAGGTIDVENGKEGRKRKNATRRRKKKADEELNEEGDHEEGGAEVGIKDEETENTDGETQGREEDMEWDEDDYKDRKAR